jgi:NhaP-type Na+/H+ or K+/H+ antiporter
VLDLPLQTSVVLGFLVAAISPAIVIPGMTALLYHREGDQRRVPSALLAGAPLDNIVALLGLGIALDLATRGSADWLFYLAHLPLSVGGGLVVGFLGAELIAWPLRRRPSAGVFTGVVVWIAACLLAFACHKLKISYVIGVLVLGYWLRRRAPALEEGLGRGLARLWSVGQVVLFGFIGAALQLAPLQAVGLAALLVIALGQLGRAAGVLVATWRGGLTGGERVACVLAYLPKATIQAAFASLPLDRGLAQGDVLLTLGVLAVVVMAPIGVFALHRGTEALLPGGRAAPEKPEEQQEQ